ncbi:MAG TPA: response regulator transcription factor [Euzebya sp.]|nr:response regulator transcription factor [Euzebya sp.]
MAEVVAAQVIGGAAAVGWVANALAVFQPGGLETDAAKARQLLRRLGGPVPRVRRRATHPVLQERGVTPREGDVLVLLAQGLTNPQIAERLFVSPRTVQTHVSSLLSKVGADSRAALAAFAVSHGILTAGSQTGVGRRS